MRIFNTLLLCFVLLCGCRSIGRVTQQDFTKIWFPPETNDMAGESSIWVLDEWKRCGSGYYKGVSIYNMDSRKLKTCKKIGHEDTICAYYYSYEIDDAYGNSLPYVAVFNIKYNSNKVVYECSGERMMGYAY
ncbi:hypothetical protein [Desulfovibrio sp. 6_1_46AFAA]|uniref:hypothetical protein n=1 Tax=Desulfovibrio sp. 6_1_46AFAA TaxID=665942 RepID=UPI0012EA9FFC|nr:hypothetical protein [Desulfovibrio sp. 6_1_46AFAA]